MVEVIADHRSHDQRPGTRLPGVQVHDRAVRQRRIRGRRHHVLHAGMGAHGSGKYSGSAMLGVGGASPMIELDTLCYMYGASPSASMGHQEKREVGMPEPKLKTLLYVVEAKFIGVVVHDSATNHPEGKMDMEAQTLVAALRMGRRVQAMTTLADGAVLFAVEPN